MRLVVREEELSIGFEVLVDLIMRHEACGVTRVLAGHVDERLRVEGGRGRREDRSLGHETGAKHAVDRARFKGPIVHSEIVRVG